MCIRDSNVDVITKSDEDVIKFINDLNKSLKLGTKLKDSPIIEDVAEGKKEKSKTKEVTTPAAEVKDRKVAGKAVKTK